ncbi:MAG: valine--tRNA ligase [Roseiflexaceae bacterium]
MSMPQRYTPHEFEPAIQQFWAEQQIYAFDPDDPRPLFAIDTPPPTVSGELHIGHIYSYVQAEAIIRFWRMQGRKIYYPFGFDDNGLPTERYVEQSRGIRARDLGRSAFIAACLETSQQAEDRFEALWQRMGISADWRLRYSTIDPHARKIAQWSFLDLYRKGRIFREQAPNPWCVECQTAIAQAELDDAERQTIFYTLRFELADQTSLPIATTRPELLPACVAIFAHPDDPRYRQLIGQQATIPLFGRSIPIMADPQVDPHKGSGAVMCCTFGDATDLHWWRTYQLPLIALIGRDGRLSAAAGAYSGLRLAEARHQILADLHNAGALLGEQASIQSIRIHERCKTAIEILETQQWFIRVLDLKEELIAAGRQITWQPAYMRTRYEHWVENLSWDWGISRQRFYGVPFPVWHCQQCGQHILAEEQQLPVDPLSDQPPHPCACGGELISDSDVMDTWATSSVSPLIAMLRWEDRHAPSESRPLAERIAALPILQLRPQAHDIIRTWAFSTIVKAHLHQGRIPWETILISGHALTANGSSIHKSLGNSPIAPDTLIQRHGADAIRYWACGGSLGADQPLNEEELRQGGRLITKLWNAARLLKSFGDLEAEPAAEAWLPTDRALRSWAERALERAGEHYQRSEYAAARAVAERFFWDRFCDNALEWTKDRLYDGAPPQRAAALATLREGMRITIQILAPIMPYITEAIYQQLYRQGDESLHTQPWRQADPSRFDPASESLGEAVIQIGIAARRFKTNARMGMGSKLAKLTVACSDPQQRDLLEQSRLDLHSLTRAQTILLTDSSSDSSISKSIRIGIES